MIMQHGARWDKPDKDKDKARQKNIRLFDTDIFWSQKASSCVMEHAQKFTVLVFWQTFYHVMVSSIIHTITVDLQLSPLIQK